MIDTQYNSFFEMSFDIFFTFIDNNVNIVYNSDEIRKIIESNDYSVYPNDLKNVLYEYNAEWSNQNGNFGIYYNNINNISLNLNFNVDYIEDLIVHNSCGGGYDADKFLSLLKINDWLVDIINQRFNLIEKPYISIHIRNTDYKTDYKTFYNNNIEEINGSNIFLATDSKETLDYFKIMKQNDKLFTFIECLNNYNGPIHSPWVKNDKKQAMIDTICDLILLALSDKLLHTPTFHGFTYLAIKLHENKKIIDNLLGN